MSTTNHQRDKNEFRECREYASERSVVLRGGVESARVRKTASSMKEEETNSTIPEGESDGTISGDA